ncbi:hypothetical protein, partial [Thiolapillus sp.]|uniref:hypothetical protein n=1 Tax=Thiolapillus sp. TaxID=2017437 RepID=UPI0025DC43F5
MECSKHHEPNFLPKAQSLQSPQLWERRLPASPDRGQMWPWKDVDANVGYFAVEAARFQSDLRMSLLKST